MKDNNLTDTMELKKGSTRTCLNESGVYELHPKSCYKFDKDFYTFDTNAPNRINLKANNYLIVGDIHITGIDDPNSLNKIEISVDSAGGSSRGTIIEALYVKDENVYRYEFWGVKSENYTFEPKNTHDLLFYPQTQSVPVNGQGCPPKVGDFDGRTGYQITGSVDPSIEGVKITVSGDDGKYEEIKYTNDKGIYTISALYDNLKYSVTAEKEGYEITRDEQNDHKFHAIKLGTIEVAVVDQDNEPLSEVIVTLTNEDASFLKHLPTEMNGVRTFTGLYPGRYYVRTTLKEYTFEGKQSADVAIKEGDLFQYKFVARRIAYSIFGNVYTLSKKALGKVTIEAIPADTNAFRETTRSNDEGSYRLRGLQPDHTYTIRIKPSKAIHRSSPEQMVVQVGNEDIKDADFVVFESLKKFSIDGFINTTSDENLTVKLSTTQNENKIIRTLELTNAMRYFEFDKLPKTDTHKYIVQVSSSDTQQNSE
eukprot:UN06525